MHEYGHILQGKSYGPWEWYTTIGPQSLKSANNDGKNGHVHKSFWTETDANILSSNFFNGFKWNNKRFPLIRQKPTIPLPSSTFDSIISQIK